jgi:spoIIIJ-associated protein
MSSKILEIEEKTIDGAIEKACRDFGVPREKLNIEIISEGSNGFLGLMAKKARIRASLLSLDMDFSLSSTAYAISEEPRRKAKPEPRLAAPASEVKPDVRPAPRKAETKPQTKPEPARYEKPDSKTDIKIEPRRENGTSPEPRAPKPRPAVQPPRPHVPRPAPGAEMKRADAADAPDTMPKPLTLTIPTLTAVEATTPSALKARELLVGILTQMTFDCQVNAMETDDTIILGISGDESGLLIGRRGQNLDAIQYILNKAINKSDADRKMIVVDSEDYRKRRQESLLLMAERIRDKVKKTQKPLSLSHMNAHDRRIIHLALQEDETLVTKSRGEGEFRKVIVLPAKSRNTGVGNSRARNRQ